MDGEEDETLDQQKREELLRRVNRQGATVGARTPETVAVGGEEFHLREFLIETRKVEGVPPDARDLVKEATTELSKRRKQLHGRLETESLTRAEADRIAEEIIGLDRAINALENLRRPTYGEQATKSSIADHKRWLDFLESVGK
ncbi:Uncharacterized protein AArcCO_0480 [Halalkaliarchaeum sp. AArc-CO]|uniref:DUF5788 family protein n=1 Tax=unclassified Halalkaliarchaeum TaxID=2678344 RepID=UPI00217E32F8|nr:MULTISPECIES: DUF5788 family protein [unclassified Halalkaliarchaeum]MDR5673511.1 DUF5788 family protein [Halalkaliarchaeum sp. AArc-GB]UWG49803.1 Uncharacterized protein AArcCO_0480 [Halalkaliarchaeum sp. AArc-CO]